MLLPAAGVALALRRGWPELGAIAAIPALAFMLSRFVESTGRKMAMGFLGAVPLLLLMTPDDYRVALDLGGIETPVAAQFAALFLALFPFVLFLAHVAAFQDCLHSPVWWWLSGPWLGGVLLAAWCVLLVVTALLPAYDAGHRQVVRLRESVDLPESQATLVVRSADSLAGVRLQAAADAPPAPGSSGGLRFEGRLLEGPGGAERLELPLPIERIQFEAVAERDMEGAHGAIVCRTRLKLPRSTDGLSYLLSSRSGFRLPDRDQTTRHAYTYTEISPQTDPAREFRLILPEGGDLSVAVRAEAAEDLLGIQPSDGSRVFVYQALVTASRRVLGPEPTAPH